MITWSCIALPLGCDQLGKRIRRADLLGEVVVAFYDLLGNPEQAGGQHRIIGGGEHGGGAQRMAEPVRPEGFAEPVAGPFPHALAERLGREFPAMPADPQRRVGAAGEQRRAHHGEVVPDVGRQRVPQVEAVGPAGLDLLLGQLNPKTLGPAPQLVARAQ